jgi:hypothetical protein
MLEKELIIEKLESLHEHKMAKDIFVPVLKKMGCHGVKFTGGPDETGIDLEYYEHTQPENSKSYVGVQFKKGSLVYSSGGSKNSVKEVKNQAEEAFEKEIHDIETHATLYISRFVVAATGDINEKARSFIGKARQKGVDRRIDYWTGDRLAEYVQDYWMPEFIEYFDINESDESEPEEINVIDEEYIEENHKKLVRNCQKLRSTVDTVEWRIIRELLALTISEQGGSVPLAVLLMELEGTEDYFSQEFRHLHDLGYLGSDESGFWLDGHARNLWDLFDAIQEEITDAEENPEQAEAIFESLIS